MRTTDLGPAELWRGNFSAFFIAFSDGTAEFSKISSVLDSEVALCQEKNTPPAGVSFLERLLLLLYRVSFFKQGET